MDNSLVHIPVTAFLKSLCRVLIVDSIVFLAKLGWALYYTILGLKDKIEEKHGATHDASHPDPLLAFTLGCALIFGVLLRYLSNLLMYQDASHTLATGERSVRRFICTRCCANSRAWVTIAILNLGFCTIVTAVLGQLSAGTGLIFILWEVIILLVIAFLKIFIYRYFLTLNPNPTESTI